jgi:hypothetical protein
MMLKTLESITWGLLTLLTWYYHYQTNERLVTAY